jgi:predicted O-linked N-acetylglucosamine transferase (SPINDLY family)
MSTKKIIHLLKEEFDGSTVRFFESIDEINAHVEGLSDLMRLALSESIRGVALNHPSFYEEFLSLIQFRVPVHSTLPLRELAALRAQMVSRDLARYRLDQEFNFSDSGGDSLRYGLVVKQLRPDPETRAIFGYLPKKPDKRVEAHVFVLNKDSDMDFLVDVTSTGARVIALPESIGDIVKTIRKFNLDYVFFANDVSAKYSVAAKLAFFRLAAKAGVGVSTIMPVASPALDQVFAGDFFVTYSDRSEYPCRMVGGSHPGYSFRALDLSASVAHRVAARVNSRQITFFSGSNFWKINGDVIRLWAEVLRAIPNSRIKLSLFPPHYASGNALAIIQRISRLFTENGVDASRVDFLNPSSSSEGWYDELVNADVYLDSFPYSSLTSIHDAINCGLPTVVLRGPYLRNCHAPAILEHIDSAWLAAANKQEYIGTCVSLASDDEKRREIRQTIYASRNRLSDVSSFFSSFLHAVRL